MGRAKVVRGAILGGAMLAVVSAGVAGTAVSASGTDTPPAHTRTSCTPGYKPCIPNKPSDVDCYGGGGNGPRYTRPGVVYKVTGYDRYRLDADHDHRGCE